MQRFPEIQICTFIITAVFLLLFLNTQRTGTLQCPLQHMVTFIPDTQQLPGHQTKGWFKGWFFLQISFRFPRVINCYATNSIKTLKSNVRKLFFVHFLQVLPLNQASVQSRAVTSVGEATVAPQVTHLKVLLLVSVICASILDLNQV